MKFIKKKNLTEGEDILYIPQTHWIYAVKPLVYSLPYFLLLFVLWSIDKSFIPDQITMITDIAIRNAFLAGLLVVLLIFVYRIFLYVSIEYGVTNKRLMFKRGIFRLTVAEIPFDRIESLYCVQGVLGRICHYGTISVSGIGGMMPIFKTVYRPYALRRVIVDIMEKNKAITVVHGDIPGPNAAKPEIAKQEPIYRYGTFVKIMPDRENL